jgi:SAM-dependent methyltransferase
MAASLKVFIPAARLEEFYIRARMALRGQKAALTLERPLAVLDLASLACFDLAVVGSSWRCRAPYIFPLLSTVRDMCYPEWHGKPLENIPGVDWVVLGGNPDHFSLALARGALRCGYETVQVIPFLDVAGALPRQRQESDVSVRLSKKWFFVNHIAVAQVLGQLLELPEERWPETGYVAVQDHFGKFRPYIEERLARPPRLIVELGCGLGQTTRSLAARFPEARVIGLDVSRDALTVAREKFRLPNLEYREFDFANRFAFDDRSVDLIVSSSALNISDNQSRTASETFRILADDGLLVNGCIFEAFHAYWDFPQSAFRPTRSNLFLHDWLAAATRRGLGMELYHWTQANSPHYFACARLDAFPPVYEGLLAGIRHEPFVPYDYTQCTGYMVAGGRAVTAPDIRVPPANHLDALEDILQAFDRLNGAGQALTDMNWLAVSSCLGLFPEARTFLRACLPGASHVIGRALDPEVLERLRHRAA